jgi:hypothetical protein
MKLTREEARVNLGVGVRAGPPNAVRRDQRAPCSPEGSVRARVPRLEATAPTLRITAAWERP